MEKWYGNYGYGNYPCDDLKPTVFIESEAQAANFSKV